MDNKDSGLQKAMSELFEELSNSGDKKTDRLIIAKAVQLGMKYQEEKIKKGIQIVFDELK